jgi:hypothetical protein
VPDKDEYAILADGLREERAKNASDSSMDDEDLQSRTSEETYRAQKTRTIDRDDKNIFLYHESVDDKSSAPSDAGSDQNVNMEGLAQWAIRIEKNCNQLINHITEPTTMNGRVFFVVLRSGTAEFAPLRSILSDRNYRQGNLSRQRTR